MCVAAMSQEESPSSGSKGGGGSAKAGAHKHGGGSGRAGAVLRAATHRLLRELSGHHPDPMLYSTYMRWGMLLEVRVAEGVSALPVLCGHAAARLWGLPLHVCACPQRG